MGLGRKGKWEREGKTLLAHVTLRPGARQEPRPVAGPHLRRAALPAAHEPAVDCLEEVRVHYCLYFGCGSPAGCWRTITISGRVGTSWCSWRRGRQSWSYTSCW